MSNKGTASNSINDYEVARAGVGILLKANSPSKRGSISTIPSNSFASIDDDNKNGGDVMNRRHSGITSSSPSLVTSGSDRFDAILKDSNDHYRFSRSSYSAVPQPNTSGGAFNTNINAYDPRSMDYNGNVESKGDGMKHEHHRKKTSDVGKDLLRMV